MTKERITELEKEIENYKRFIFDIGDQAHWANPHLCKADHLSNSKVQCWGHMMLNMAYENNLLDKEWVKQLEHDLWEQSENYRASLEGK